MSRDDEWTPEEITQIKASRSGSSGIWIPNRLLPYVERITNSPPIDSLYEECLATQGDPEVSVTSEMRTAGRRVLAGHFPTCSLQDEIGHGTIVDHVFRAMAAVAPKGTDMWAEYLASQRRVAELVADLAKTQREPNPRNVPYDVHDRALSEILTGNEGIEARDQRIAELKAENADLLDKFNRKSEAAMRESDDKNATIARLREENAAMASNSNLDVVPYTQYVDDLAVKDAVIAELEQKYQLAIDQLAAFTADPLSQQGSSDLPDPPRRPDGTLAPPPKPWTPPKPNGDPRMIGN